MANGVAQSIVSLARGFGPLLGGYVRSVTRAFLMHDFLTLFPALVCISTREPIGLLHRVPDGRFGMRASGLPHLLYPLVIPLPFYSCLCVRTATPCDDTVRTSRLPILTSRYLCFVSSFRSGDDLEACRNEDFCARQGHSQRGVRTAVYM